MAGEGVEGGWGSWARSQAQGTGATPQRLTQQLWTAQNRPQRGESSRRGRGDSGPFPNTHIPWVAFCYVNDFSIKLHKTLMKIQMIWHSSI